jgi:hypothetical protein
MFYIMYNQQNMLILLTTNFNTSNCTLSVGTDSTDIIRLFLVLDMIIWHHCSYFLTFLKRMLNHKAREE